MPAYPPDLQDRASTGRPPAVAVVGPANASRSELAAARAVGRGLAETGAMLVTGGLDGVMAAAARGAVEAGGTVLGLLPGTDRRAANRWVTVAVPTGLGEGRDALVVRSAAAVVAVGGSWGTLAEVALACRAGLPVVSVGGWTVRDRSGRRPAQAPVRARDAVDAVNRVRRLLTAVGRARNE